jgi:hypothetical protein
MVDVWARILAATGVVLALGSLLWQVVEWLLSGSRITVEPARVGIAATVPGSTEVIGFTVRNRGRSGTTVEMWGLLLPDGRVMVFWTKPTGWSNPELPHSLASGTGATWTIPLEWVRQAAREETVSPVEVRPQVTLGTGKKKAARRATPIPS